MTSLPFESPLVAAASSAPLRSSERVAPADGVPRVVELAPAHRNAMTAHLLGLSGPDRQLRFGMAVDDDSVRAYVRRLDLDRDIALGVIDRSSDDLLAFGHLALPPDGVAELGLSVWSSQRGRGLGAALLRRAAQVARHRGARRLVMTYVDANRALERMAARAGMQVHRVDHEPVAELTLQEPEPAGEFTLAMQEAGNLVERALLRLLTPPAPRAALTSA